MEWQEGLSDSICSWLMSVHHYQEWSFPSPHGSGLIAFELVLAFSAQQCTNGVWPPQRLVSVARRSRLQITLWQPAPCIDIQTGLKVWHRLMITYWSGCLKHVRPFNGPDVFCKIHPKRRRRTVVSPSSSKKCFVWFVENNFKEEKLLFC